jgi:hypothetical protein
MFYGIRFWPDPLVAPRVRRALGTRMNNYLSDLTDRRIDFDQWEFCVVWATHISFLYVLSAVPSFLSHARKSKPAERRDRSQSNLFLDFGTLFKTILRTFSPRIDWLLKAKGIIRADNFFRLLPSCCLFVWLSREGIVCFDN